MKKLIVVLLVFLGFSLTNCDKVERTETSNVKVTSASTEISGLKGGGTNHQITREQYREAQDKAMHKMIKKLMAKKNKGGLVPANQKQLQVSTPSATLEAEIGSMRIQQAPPPSNDSIPPFEELEPYMDEQIA